MKLPIIGVLGAADNSWNALDEGSRERIAGRARALGGWLASFQVHLLTGGGGGVMAHVSEGFTDGNTTRRGSLLGIIPGTVTPDAFPTGRRLRDDPSSAYQPKEGYPNRWIEIPIFTHLVGSDPYGPGSRNWINALTADILLAFPGGKGTMAEVRLARSLGKPVVAYLQPSEQIGGGQHVLASNPAPGELPPGVTVANDFEALKTAVHASFALVPALTATKQVEIRFAASGEGTLNAHGLGSYPCLGQPGRQYPHDLTVYPEDKEAHHYSQEFQVMMDWAVRIWGQYGIYIHEGPDTLAANDNSPSAGCIHLGPGNAKTFYDWVDGRTRIQIAYPW